MRRLLPVTIFALLALAPAAHAATVGVQDAAKKLRFIAEPGEVNRVIVTQAGNTISFEDLGAPVTAAALQTACVNDTASKVTCTLPSALYRAQVEAEDGDDEITSLATSLVKMEGDDGADRITGGEAGDEIAGGAGPDTIDGRGGSDTIDAGDGDDVIQARDALRDVVLCNLGDDAGQADIEDELTDCERVEKPLAPPTVGDQPTAEEPTDAGDQGLHLGALPKPIPGQRVAVGITSGTARVKLPGSSQWVALDPTKAVPVGSSLNALTGVVTLVSASNLTGATQSARFSGGVFKVSQVKSRRMTTVLTLTGGDFSSCRKGSRTAARAAAAKPIRKLFGSGHGRFTTRGRNSAATVRGTIWSVSDRCDGTLTRVQRGLVSVKDLRTKKTRLVSAGQQYLARR